MSTLACNHESLVFKNRIAYTKATEPETEDTLFKGCLYLPDTFLTENQKRILTELSDAAKLKFRCCWYVAATLTVGETKKLGDFDTPDKKSIYLHYLVDQCMKGDRYCYQLNQTERQEESAADLTAKMDAMQAQMTTFYGDNAGVVMRAVATGNALPNVEQSMTAAMVGYSPTLLASKHLAEKLSDDLEKARVLNVDPDAVTLATTLLATGQMAKMKAIMLEGARGTDLNAPMMKHLTSLKVGQQLVLDSINHPEGEEEPVTNLRTKLNLTAFQWPVEGIPELTLLPLAGEIAAITKGRDALPQYMLLKLQENWKKEDKSVTIPKYVSGSKREWLDNAVLAVHKNVHEIQDMKNTLWAEIGQNPEVKNQLPECQKYARNMEFSYIRLVFELRKRLSHDSNQLYLYEAYRKLAQRTGELATEFVARAASLREQAYCNSTDENYENVYTNPWDQHYEIVLRGFSNKQLMGEISRIDPKNMATLREAVQNTESMFSRNIRLGLVQGQEDPRALVGLPMPSEEVIQQIQALTGNCFKCGDRGHLMDQCPCPTSVCYRCKQPGHLKFECKVYMHEPQPRGGGRARKPGRGPNRHQADQKENKKIQQLTVPGTTEAVWTPFSHAQGFPNGSQ
jgi:hypothetical protein